MQSNDAKLENAIDIYYTGRYVVSVDIKLKIDTIYYELCNFIMCRVNTSEQLITKIINFHISQKHVGKLLNITPSTKNDPIFVMIYIRFPVNIVRSVTRLGGDICFIGSYGYNVLHFIPHDFKSAKLAIRKGV